MTPDQPFAAWQQWMGSSPFPGVPGMEASLREGWSKALEQLQNFDATELGVTGAAMRQAPQIRFAPEKLQQLQQDYLREATLPMAWAVAASRMPKPTPTGMCTCWRMRGSMASTSAVLSAPEPVTPLSDT